MISQFISKSLSNKEKLFALLIDPDQHTNESLINLIDHANQAKVDLLLIGGSLLNNDIDLTLETIKKWTDTPALLFPGNLLQITNKADGILLLSLISGRNPDLLIGNHVIASAYIKRSNLEVLPTGYILIDGGKPTSVEYMSNTKPIPGNKIDIAIATAMAGEMLGLQYIYLEAGSGANNSVNAQMIKGVKNNISIPLIVGGGIKDESQVKKIASSGADIIVVGNAVENNPGLLLGLVKALKE